jgi:hypothetical protein
MRLCFLIVFINLVVVSFAQDDLPDYRSKREFFTRIMEKDIRSDIASFSMGGIEESVGKLPLATIPIVFYGKDSMTFAANDIKVIIKAADFEPAKHKLNYYDPEKTHLVRIDGKPYYGDYGKVPKTTVQRVTVIIDRDTINVPPAACTDLANPVFTFNDRGVAKSQNKVFLSADGRKIYVYMLKPETGGSYEATWVIQDKKYVKRVVDFGFLK